MLKRYLLNGLKAIVAHTVVPTAKVVGDCHTQGETLQMAFATNLSFLVEGVIEFYNGQGTVATVPMPLPVCGILLG